jgi:hypothetical protein
VPDGAVTREREAVTRLIARVVALYGIETRLEVSTGPLEGLAPADLVVSRDGASWPSDVGRHLRSLATLARKVLLVVVSNPERLGSERQGRSSRETLSLAPVLWELGRVREHEYLVIPRALEMLNRLTDDAASSAVLRGPLGAMVRRTAMLHAFVVDLAPRTPQARRRLRAVEEEARKGARDV